MAFKTKTILAPAAFAALALVGLSSAASAQVRVGLLECNVSAGTGMVITSTKALDCLFRPDGGAPEHYFGTVTRYGLDVGMTNAGKLAWGVLAPTAIPGAGALQGTYTGVGGGATVGVGATANVLVGGSGQTTSLQPLSISGQTGLNVTAGVGQIALEYAPPPPAPRMRRKKRMRHRHH